MIKIYIGYVTDITNAETMIEVNTLDYSFLFENKVQFITTSGKLKLFVQLQEEAVLL